MRYDESSEPLGQFVESFRVMLSRMGFILLIIFILVTCLYTLKDLLSLLVASLFFSYIVETFLQFLRSKLLRKFKLKRVYLIGLAYLVIFITLLLIIFTVFPPLYTEFESLVTNLPKQLKSFWENIWTIIQRFQFKVSDWEVINLTALSQKMLNMISSLFSKAYIYLKSTLSSTLGVLSALVIVPIFGFYLTYYRDSIFKASLLIFPRSFRDDVSFTLITFDRAMSEYVRTLGLNVLMMSALTAILLLPFTGASALALGVMYGVSSIVPVVGPIIGAIPGIVIGFNHGLYIGITVVILYVLIQQFCDNFLTPRVLGKSFKMNPLGVILAMYIFVKLFGVVGVLIAVPATYTIYKLIVRIACRV